MLDQQSVAYTCPVCGYRNIWTLDEVLQRGRKEIFKDPTLREDRYSLPCKNLATPHCPERYIVAIKQEED